MYTLRRPCVASCYAPHVIHLCMSVCLQSTQSASTQSDKVAMEYVCCKQAKRGKKSKAEAAVPAATATSSSQVSSGKDTGLALFHALGKILYNKRPDAAEGSADADSVAGAGAEDCLLPVSSSALQMPSSRNKPCEVADRLDMLTGWQHVCICHVWCASSQALRFFL